MIDVNYNEYKETIAENIKLIEENHRLKERLSIYESDSDTVIMSKEKWEETKKELEIEKDISDGMLKAIDKAIKYIEENSLYEQDYDYDYEENLVEYPPSDEQAKKDLLDILKGNDDNVSRKSN